MDRQLEGLMDTMDKFFMVCFALLGICVMVILYDVTVKVGAVSCLSK